MTRIEGKKAQVLLDEQFANGPLPNAQLPHLAWVGVWNQMDPSGALWHPDEAPRLEKLEANLMSQLEKFGNGWAVYVRRVATVGMREYYVYFGDSAQLSKAFVAFQEANPNYRIEVEFKEDPTWSGYTTWLKDAPLV